MLTKPGMFKRDHESLARTASAQSGASSSSPERPAVPSHAAVASPAHPAFAERKADAPAAPASGSRLIVGPDVKLKGAEIHDCDTLVVEGRVEATMDSRVIQIAPGGAFSGKVGIDVAEVHGQFDGELTARSQLVIYATGRVSGKIRYGKILIEEGGEVSGDVAASKPEGVKTSPLQVAGIKDVAVG